MSTLVNADSSAILLQLEKEWNEMDEKLIEEFLLGSVDIISPEQFANVILYGFNELNLSRSQLSKLLILVQTLKIKQKMQIQTQTSDDDKEMEVENDNKSKEKEEAVPDRDDELQEVPCLETMTDEYKLLDFGSLILYSIFSYLQLCELLMIEIVCKTFRIHCHHPLSFNNNEKLQISSYHYKYNLFRFKNCKFISFKQEKNININRKNKKRKKENIYFNHRHKEIESEWKSIFIEINKQMKNIKRIEIPVNFFAFHSLINQILINIDIDGVAIEELIINGTNQIILNFDHDNNENNYPFSVFTPSFDENLSNFLLKYNKSLNKLILNNILLQIPSLTINALSTNDKSKQNTNMLVLNECHVGHVADAEVADVDGIGIYVKNILIRNAMPYSNKYGRGDGVNIDHPLLLPITNCLSFMLNWTVIRNDYDLENLSNLSNINEFHIKFHENVAIDTFIGYCTKIKIGKNVNKLFLCIDDDYKTFEHDINDSNQLINIFLNKLFCQSTNSTINNIKQFRVKFVRASWCLIDVVITDIIEKYGENIDKFEFFYCEPTYKKFKTKKRKRKKKIPSQKNRKLNAMTNIFNAIQNKLSKNASYIYIKISKTEKFQSDIINELKKDFKCLTEKIDKDQYIYQFLLTGNTKPIKPTYTFAINEFEKQYE